LAPLFRASESPIAIACFLLLTLRPDLPLLSVPALRFFMARPTFFAAPLEYFRFFAFLAITAILCWIVGTSRLELGVRPKVHFFDADRKRGKAPTGEAVPDGCERKKPGGGKSAGQVGEEPLWGLGVPSADGREVNVNVNDRSVGSGLISLVALARNFFADLHRAPIAVMVLQHAENQTGQE
jgi:hypothetical protein